MQRSMAELAVRVASGRRSYEQTRRRLAATEERITENEARLRALRDLADKATADAYMRGPTYHLSALLDADSMADVVDVISFSNAIARRNAELSEQVLRAGDVLAKERRLEAQLEKQGRAALARFTEEQAVLAKTFADTQVRLADLAGKRARLGALLLRLRNQLRAEELAAAYAAANGGTPLSFGRWAETFLSHLHFPVARNNLIVMVAWQAAEWTDARWNPLATTWRMPGSTDFNSSRVQNYSSLRQGLEATTKTLRRAGYGYEAILAGLARNAEPMETARAINESRWCRGCTDGQYVIGLIDAVTRYYERYANERA